MGEVIEVPGVTEADLRATLLAEVTELCQPSTPVAPGEVTIGEMAAAWGQSTSTAQTLLDRKVDEGTLSKRKALNTGTGRECWAYRVVT